MSLESSRQPSERKLESEETLDPHTIALATSTFYPTYGEGDSDSPDNVRGRLALEFLSAAAQDGYQVVVVDGLSSKKWKAELEALRGHTGILVEQGVEPGLSGSRREAIKKAASLAGVRVVGQSEPEKIDIEKQVKKLALPIINGKAAVTVPHRGDSGMTNYPEAQRKAEARANKLANAIVKNDQNIDWWVGVRFIKNDPQILEPFLKKRIMSGESKLLRTSNPGDWSDAMYTPLVELLKDNPSVVQSVDVAYSHPTEQTRSEEGNPSFDQKRARQLHSIITNIVEAMRIQEKKEGKPSRLLEFERMESAERTIDVLYFDPIRREWTKLPESEKSFSQLHDLCRSFGSGKSQTPAELLHALRQKGIDEEFLGRLRLVLRDTSRFSMGEISVGNDTYVGVLQAASNDEDPKTPVEVFLSKIQPTNNSSN